jgi:uncharacterized sporulation protein YeaH/YhbH (DUF444 family)
MASKGCIMDLDPKCMAIDIENNFKPSYVEKADRKDVITHLKEMYEKVDEIYIATDPDREGEMIAWTIARILKIKEPIRLRFGEITKSAVLKAIENRGTLDRSLIDAQKARRFLDRIVGYTLSPILHKIFKIGNLSAGRVQSVLLRLIVDREKEIAELKRRIEAVPFIDTFDLRFNNFVKRPVPSSQAVMFCLMDVSGSMDQPTKDMAKRFYILLYLFLTRTYKNVEVVFIRHHTQAKEVNEHDFFYSQETGGTIVSSALELMSEIMHSRYPANEWNIYAAQASDGDNWADDSPHCRKLLEDQIMPWVRYFSYIEITTRAHQSLWFQYEELAKQFPHFAMENIRKQEDIYPVFRELFKKQAA